LPVRLRLYGILAAGAGGRVVEVDESGCGSVECLLRRAAAGNPGLARALEAVGWEVVIVSGGRRLEPSEPPPKGGELQILPPASGGSAARVEAGILRPGEELDLDELVSRLALPGVGAVAVFVGVVRSPERGEEVEYLDYDYDERLTPAWLERLAREEAEAGGLRGVAVYHYVGRRRPGERTMIVAVAAPHRREALEALSRIVDRVKREAPIWKAEKRGGRVYYHVGDREVTLD
jgi:molybdopterin synthase catalytic subunit/molybdopterin converting factor small subunit